MQPFFKIPCFRMRIRLARPLSQFGGLMAKFTLIAVTPIKRSVPR
jgi:hypothetical protein